MDQKRTYWIVGGVIGVLAIAAVFLFTRPSEAQSANTDAETVTAFIGDLAASATASGQLVAQQEAALSPERSGTVETVAVRVGQAVSAGDLLMQLETDTLLLELASAEQALLSAEASLASLLEPPAAEDLAAAEAAVFTTQANLDEALAGATPEEIAEQEANLRASEADVWASSAQLNQINESVTAAQIAEAEANLAAAQTQLALEEMTHTRNPDPDNTTAVTALANARNSVATAQAQLDALLAGPNANSVNQSQANLAASSANRDVTQAQIDQALADPTTATLASLEAAVASAESTLANLVEGATAEEIAAQEARVAQAQLDLADAQEALDAASIVAPFDGVITAVNFQEGERASGIVVEMVDLSSLEVVLDVDELDIRDVTVGQSATVTLETWPDAPIASSVSFVATSGTTALGSNIVTYEVRLNLEATDLPIRNGMTANASLVTAQQENILLVPNSAITADRQTGSYSVTLASGEMVNVTVGLRDSQYTEITSGLTEGDRLLLSNTLPLEATDGPPERNPFEG